MSDIDFKKIPEVVDEETFLEQKILIEKSGIKKITHSDLCDCKFSNIQMCFSYALKIPEDILKENYFNYRGFIKFLIDNNLLIRDKKGNIVLFGQYPDFEHMGLMINHSGNMISKLGYGHLWKCAPEKMSDYYGEYDFYKLPDNFDVVNKIKEYSKLIKYIKQI